MTPSHETEYGKIILSHGQFALVSTEDFDRISQWQWRAIWNKNTCSFYAVSTQIVDGKRRLFRMHRVILGLEFGDGRLADHIRSGKTLDNRRSNLRIATKSQNQGNRRINKNNTSGYPGVRKVEYWVAVIKHQGKDIYLGTFKTPEAAHRAYKSAATRLRKEFAALLLSE